MKKAIVIENHKFSYDIGLRLLKLKYTECPFPELADVWDTIEPLTFAEIAEFENLEDRRVGILCLGIERLVKEVNPKLLDTKTITKTTPWITKDGVLQSKTFEDTYELYKVSSDYFTKGVRWGRMNDAHFVKCKDTSTNREYLIWVDLEDVYRTNNNNRWDFNENKVNAIQAIAWTIQTNVPEGEIEKIIRQGDCVLIKSKSDHRVNVRHLTEKEYRTLLVAES